MRRGDVSLLLQDGQADILYTFWNDVTRTLGEEFHAATEGGWGPLCVPQFKRMLTTTQGELGFVLKAPLTPASCLHVASSFLKQAFEGEYPKLLRLYNELWRRLQQYSTSLQGALPATTGLDSAIDISGAELDSQDLFTHGKQDYK